MMINDLLLEIYLNVDEAQLTHQRTQLLGRQDFLLELAIAVDLKPMIIMGKGDAQNCKGKGRQKILSDVMKAVIGAMFIDSDRDYALIKERISHYAGLEADLKAAKNQALFKAIREQDLTKVKSALKQGADPNQSYPMDYEISCPCSIKQDSLPMWLEIINTARKSNALDLAIRRFGCLTENTLPIVEALLEYGANPNCLDNFEYGVLHETIVYYPKRSDNADAIFPKLCLLLCQYGADPNLACSCFSISNPEKEDKKFTSLEAAIISANAEKVEILLRHGANPNLKNSQGQTALHLTAYYAMFYLKEEQQFQQMAKQFSFFHPPQTNYMSVFKRIIMMLRVNGAQLETADNQGKLAVDLTHPAFKSFFCSNSFEKIDTNSDSDSDSDSNEDEDKYYPSIVHPESTCMIQ